MFYGCLGRCSLCFDDNSEMKYVNNDPGMAVYYRWSLGRMYPKLPYGRLAVYRGQPRPHIPNLSASMNDTPMAFLGRMLVSGHKLKGPQRVLKGSCRTTLNIAHYPLVNITDGM